MAINLCLLWFICYILHSDWSLLLLVNTQDSFHCKQSMLNLKVVYTVNKEAYRKHHFTTSGVYGTESTEFTTSCQYNTHLLPQKQG